MALVSHDAQPCRAAAPSWVASALTDGGHWNGDFETAFAVSGNHVRAVDAHDHGLFLGEIVAHRVVGHWCEAPPHASDRDTGDAAFTFARSGDDVVVAGHYRYGRQVAWAGRWDLEHDRAAPSPALTARLVTQSWQCGTPP